MEYHLILLYHSNRILLNNCLSLRNQVAGRTTTDLSIALWTPIYGLQCSYQVTLNFQVLWLQCSYSGWQLGVGVFSLLQLAGYVRFCFVTFGLASVGLWVVHKGSTLPFNCLIIMYLNILCEPTMTFMCSCYSTINK